VPESVSTWPHRGDSFRQARLEYHGDRASRNVGRQASGVATHFSSKTMGILAVGGGGQDHRREGGVERDTAPHKSRFSHPFIPMSGYAPGAAATERMIAAGAEATRRALARFGRASLSLH
jgi:hypothetical protein